MGEMGRNRLGWAGMGGMSWNWLYIGWNRLGWGGMEWAKWAGRNGLEIGWNEL